MGPSSFFPISAPVYEARQTANNEGLELGRTAELDTEHSLELAEDLGIGDGLSRLVVLEDGRLLVDTLGNILLGELLL